MIAKFDREEWMRSSTQEDVRLPLLYQIGMAQESLLVVGLQTCEGGIFNPKKIGDGECARYDLNGKHQIWVCILFEDFLVWLYKTYDGDIDALPSSITLDIPFNWAGYRRNRHGAEKEGVER